VATSRRLQLLAALQATPGVSATRLAARFGTTTRTIRRDIDHLRELGYRIEGSPGRHGGYQLAGGRQTPPLILDDDEAVAVGLGLRLVATAGIAPVGEAAAAAIAKLESGLPSRVRARLAAASEVEVARRPQRATVAVEVLSAIAVACRRPEALWLVQRSAGAPRARGRDVQPHKLVHVAGRWYLVAFDVAATEWRSFRLDRVTEARPTGTRWPTLPPPGDPVAFVTRAIATDGWPHLVELRLFLDAETATALVDPTLGTIHADGDGCRLVIGTDDLAWTARRVAALDVDLEVIGPPEFARAMADLGSWLRTFVPPTSER
jgi:predicted DNA-binding transcriptional regulator YafY